MCLLCLLGLQLQRLANGGRNLRELDKVDIVHGSLRPPQVPQDDGVRADRVLAGLCHAGRQCHNWHRLVLLITPMEMIFNGRF